MQFSDFKDYYAALGVARTASQDEIKRAFRKLARKFHPDVSKEPDAENRFKEVAEAHEALIDPQRRAAYDDLAHEHALARKRAQSGAPGAPGSNGSRFSAPPGHDSGYEFSGPGRAGGAQRGEPGTQDFSAFFESLFGSGSGHGEPIDPAMGDFMAGSTGGARAGTAGARRARRAGAATPQHGADHHARIEISLADAYAGARHVISLRHPQAGPDGRMGLHERQVEVNIPKGVRPGQHLRLAGLGEMGQTNTMTPDDGATATPAAASAGDLYLEIAIRPQPGFRLDGADVWTDLVVAPWEAALGASVPAATPEGTVELTIPAGSSAGRKLRLKGRGLPGAGGAGGANGQPPGDLYAVLQIRLPAADSVAARAAWAALAEAFPAFDPRHNQEA